MKSSYSGHTEVIKVTRSHYRQGIKRNILKCPLSLAVNDKLGCNLLTTTHAWRIYRSSMDEVWEEAWLPLRAVMVRFLVDAGLSRFCPEMTLTLYFQPPLHMSILV